MSLIIIIDDFHFLATWNSSNAPNMKGLAQNDTLTEETNKGGFFLRLVHYGSIGVNDTLLVLKKYNYVDGHTYIPTFIIARRIKG